MIEKLGLITKAGLQLQERDILTYYLSIDYEDGWSQQIGHTALDEYNEVLKKRVGTQFGCQLIRDILEALHVDNLHEAAGKYIWVLGTQEKGVLSFSPKGFKTMRADGPTTVIFYKED